MKTNGRSVGLIALATALVVMGGAPAFSQMSGEAKPAAKLSPILSDRDVDPIRLLPPPAADGIPVANAELAELHKVQDARTPAELEKAIYNDKHESAAVFAKVLGPNFDLDKLPATAKLLAQVHADDSAAAKRAKDAFKRMRPYGLDATVIGCPHAEGKPLTSYPSGHATMGFTAATVLADLIPEKAKDIQAFAADYGHDRMVCGHHYRSDVVAGEVLGAVVGVQLLHSPALKSDIDAARAELRAAGLTH